MFVLWHSTVSSPFLCGWLPRLCTRSTDALCGQTSNRRIATFWSRGCCPPIILCLNTTHIKRKFKWDKRERGKTFQHLKKTKVPKKKKGQWHRSSIKKTWCAREVQRITIRTKNTDHHRGDNKTRRGRVLTSTYSRESSIARAHTHTLWHTHTHTHTHLLYNTFSATIPQHTSSTGCFISAARARIIRCISVA